VLNHTSTSPYACTVFASTAFYLQNAELYGIVTVDLNAVDEVMIRREILDIL